LLECFVILVEISSFKHDVFAVTVVGQLMLIATGRQAYIP